MPILFEALTPVPLYAEVPRATLTLGGHSLGFALDADSSVVLGGFSLTGGAFAEDSDIAFEPNVPAQMVGGFTLAGASEAFSIDYDEIFGELTLTGLSLPLEADEAMVPAGAMTLTGFAMAGPGVETSYSFLVEHPAVIYGVPGSLITTGVEDSLSLSDETTGLLDLLIHSVLTLTDAPAVLLQFVAQITSTLQLRDSLALLLDGQLTSAINLEDVTDADLRMIGLLADVVDFSDAPEAAVSPLVTVVSALVLLDSLALLVDGALEDSAQFDSQVSARIAALVEAVSSLEVTDEATPTLHMLATVDSQLELSDDPEALLALMVELLDTVGFAVRFDTGSERFAGYTLNLRNAAVSEYENFHFNSMALVGGRAYGAREDGVYLLEGDTDAGDPIQAFVRTGVLNLESLSHVTKAWIGLTSSGDMIFKTITTDGGKKKEHWYRMEPRPQGAPVESRFNPAKGVTSTFWQWELANVDGAYFELDMLKVWPLSIGRRYSGR